jgi:hypothetical protein
MDSVYFTSSLPRPGEQGDEDFCPSFFARVEKIKRREMIQSEV